MNTLKGPFKIVAKEMSLTFYINVGITLALFALYIFLSTQLDANKMLGLTFGPFYIVFLTYAFVFFKSYKFILSLGGTRKQFMISSFIVSSLYIAGAAIILTVIHYAGKALLQEGYVFHMADLLNNTNPLMYFWVDFLWLTILFAIGMFAQVINFNLGTLRILILGGILILGSVALYFFIDLTPLVEFIVQDHLLFLHLSALISLALMATAYFMMRNAPLERGDRKFFPSTTTN